ncbi:endonuclease/exonuclease/phosphatase family protein, partial [Nocardioides sp. Y6]
MLGGLAALPPHRGRVRRRIRRTTKGDAVRRRMTTWILGAVLAAGLATTAQSQTSDTDAGPIVAPEIVPVAAPSKLVVIQHNTDGSRTRYDSALQEAADTGAHAVILQEVCNSWVKEGLPTGWQHNYSPTKTKTTANACPGPHTDKGVLVAWTRPAEAVTTPTFSLKKEPKDRTRKPKLVCLGVTSGAKYTICGTHLVAFKNLCPDKDNPTPDCMQPADEIREQQARKIRNKVKGWLGDRRVIIGGDFNTNPKDTPLDYLYAQPAGASKQGRFIEAEQLGSKGKPVRKGQDTAEGRKIDYLFFSDNFTSVKHPGKLAPLKFIDAETPNGVKSGHARLLATVQIPDSIPGGDSAGDGSAPAPAPCADNDCFRAQLGVQDYVHNENSRRSDVRLRRFVLDRKFYARSYPDVDAWAQEAARVHGGNKYDYVESHWLNHGIAEGRMGSATFDPAYYLSIHPDVAAAYGATNFQGAIEHYVAHGQHEGRRSSIFFDVAHYKARYADIAGASNQDAM